jgi:hypothetical protein
LDGAEAAKTEEKSFPEIDTLTEEDKNRRMILIISRVVILFRICYLPYLVEKHYFLGTVIQRAS